MSNLERPPACCGNPSRLAVASARSPIPLCTHLEVVAAILPRRALRRILAEYPPRRSRSRFRFLPASVVRQSPPARSAYALWFSLSKTYPEAHSLSSDFAVTAASSRAQSTPPLLLPLSDRPARAGIPPPRFPSAILLRPTALSVLMRIMLRALKSSVNIENACNGRPYAGGCTIGGARKGSMVEPKAERTDFCRDPGSCTRTRWR